MTTKQLHHSLTDWLSNSQLSPYVDAYKHRFAVGGYASYTVATYLACIAHFAHWLTLRQLNIQQINETVVQDFLDTHLPQCNCVWPANRVRHDLRTALGHLLIVLRANLVIAERPQGTTPEGAQRLATKLIVLTDSLKQFNIRLINPEHN